MKRDVEVYNGDGGGVKCKGCEEHKSREGAAKSTTNGAGDVVTVTDSARQGRQGKQGNISDWTNCRVDAGEGMAGAGRYGCAEAVGKTGDKRSGAGLDGDSGNCGRKRKPHARKDGIRCGL